MPISAVQKKELEIARLKAKLAVYDKYRQEMNAIKEEIKKLRAEMQAVLDLQQRKKVLQKLVDNQD